VPDPDPTKPVARVIGLGVVGVGSLFTVVGLLATRHWAAPQTTWAAMASVATVMAAVVGIWTLVSLRQDSRDRTRPVMIAEIRPGVLSDVAELLVRNAGPSVAKNVRFTFNPALPVLEGAEAAGKLTPYLKRRYSRTVPTFGPGMVMHDVYQSASEPFEPVPDDFTLTVDYDDTHGRHYTDSYELSVTTLRDHTRTEPGDRDEPALQLRVARAVEAIARGVGRR
jgi:hypothetical protein